MEQGFNPNLENNNGDTILHLSFKKSLLHCRYSDNILTNQYFTYLIKMTKIITDDKYTFQFTNDNNNNLIENYFYGFNTNGPKFDYKSHFFKCYPFLINSIRNLREINLEFDAKIERLAFFLNALGECKVEITDDKKDTIDTYKKDDLRKIIKFKQNIINKLATETIMVINNIMVFPIHRNNVIDFIVNEKINPDFIPIYEDVTNNEFVSISQINLEDFVTFLWLKINEQMKINNTYLEYSYIGPIKPKKLIKI